MLRRRPTIPAVVVVVVAVALLAGCGGANRAHVAHLSTTATQSNSSSNLPTQSSSSDPLAYSRCMRSNGVPKYPDPSSSNALPDGLPKVDFQELGVSSTQFAAAQTACARLLPNGGQSTPATSRQTLSEMVNFSQCMRSHEVPNWPDPTTGSDGSPSFNLVGIHPPVDTGSPQFQDALHACGRLVPKSLGGIRVRQP
jgi:hypothetical protein